MRRLIFGLGTGRCGTMSLARILDECDNAHVTHEGRLGSPQATGLLPWEVSEKLLSLNIKSILNRNCDIVGDVGFYYLPYVELILDKYPSTKFVCMKRGKKATVESYMRKTEGRNHWKILEKGSRWNRDPKWDGCYPKYSSKTKRQALGEYWDEYYEASEILQSKYPNNVRIFPVTSLNDAAGLRELSVFTDMDGINIANKKIYNRGISSGATGPGPLGKPRKKLKKSKNVMKIRIINRR